MGGVGVFLSFSVLDWSGFLGGPGSVPDLPVEVSFRRAMMDDSTVAGFTNFSERTLSLEVKLINPNLNAERELRLVLHPGQYTEIGWLDGWAFVRDEQICLTHPEFQTKYVTVP